MSSESFRLSPISSKLYRQLLPKSGAGLTMLEVKSTDQLFNIITKYVAEHGNKTASDHSHSWLASNSFYTDDSSGEDEGKQQLRVLLSLGLGLHEVMFEGQQIKVVHQALGSPVGGVGGLQIYTSLVLCAEGQNQRGLLSAFCDHVLAMECGKEEQEYHVYRWKVTNMWWSKVATKRVRPIESVILPADVKALVLQDLTDFEEGETGQWYAERGIPYKRCVLFYGPPGSGKSSFITALAGQLQRDVCFLQPAHPSMTDETLQLCIENAPSRSLIVMEDVDALFTRDREVTRDAMPLTFSGLLNALDGVCSPEGQVFVLTTNHIERLDPALIRPGRVDIKVRFTTATQEQVETLFLRFYPGEADLAREFAGVIASRSPEIVREKMAREGQERYTGKRKRTSSRTEGDDENEGSSSSQKKAKVGQDDDEEKEEETKRPDEVKADIPDAGEVAIEVDDGLGVSMAELQQLFIVCRKSTPAEALAKARTFQF